MINSYPSYKPSRMEWLQQVPAHWEERRAKFFFKEVNNKSENGNEELLSVSHITGVTPRSEKNVSMFMAESYVGHKVCEAGDLVINSLWTWMGALGIASQTGIVSSAYGVYRPKNKETFDSKYIDLLLRINGYKGEYLCRSTGVWTSRLGMNTEDFYDIPIVCPPLEEQKAIVVYLNAKLADIDRYIAEKEHLIELLQEQKTALINQAVTRGLNPKAKMKSSGIEWLSEIPEHWDIVSVGKVINLQRGIDITKNEQSEGNVPVVSSGGIASYHNKSMVRGPGVVVGRKGSVGKIHYVEQDFWPHDTTLYVDDFKGNLPRFVYYKLWTMDLARLDTGSSNPSLNRNNVHPLKISWPDYDEQVLIAKFLDSYLKSNEHLNLEVSKQIELLQEYRTALIAEAVTGKIDVRS